MERIEFALQLVKQCYGFTLICRKSREDFYSNSKRGLREWSRSSLTEPLSNYGVSFSNSISLHFEIFIVYFLKINFFLYTCPINCDLEIDKKFDKKII